MGKNKVLKFITGNENKFYEIKKILSPIKIERVNIDLDEIQSLDPKKVIGHKLKQAFKRHKGPFIVEDGCTYFEALNYKLPGPFIKWFNVTIGNKGILNLAKKIGKNGIRHIVTIGYAKNVKNIRFFTGEVSGKIVSAKGRGGFGFDPIFLPNGSTKTLAQLKSLSSFNFSSRGKAAKKFKNYLLSHEK